MLGRLVDEVLESATPEYPWGDTLPLLNEGDWRFCNLECVISDRGTPWTASPKTFHFRSEAKNAAVLTRAKINAVSLANNHVLDYGYDAMFEMLEILNRAGIVHSGAGANFEEASRLATTEVKGRRLGLLSFTDNEPQWEASSDRPGVFYVPIDLRDDRTQNLLDIVHKHKAMMEFLIVSAHWGSNWGYYPPEEHIALAHALIDSGADLVFGHSSHVFRGIEFYEGRPIVYGAGNFIDDYAVDPVERNDQSLIYVAELNDSIPGNLAAYPTLIRGCRANRAAGLQELIIIEKVKALCTELQTHAEWNLERRYLDIRPKAEHVEKSAKIGA